MGVMRVRSTIWRLALVLASALGAQSVSAQFETGGKEDSGELAKKLQNPIANLISVPFKVDWDTGIGPSNANRSTLFIQPVIPFSLGSDWSVISRTIVPVIDARSTAPGISNASGLGDVTQSLFFGPKSPTSAGWIWAVGPVLLLPTANKNALGGDKWGLGPTAVALKQQDGWTYGILANHIWSVAGSDRRAAISATYLQPFLSYTTKTYTTFGTSVESTYNWKTSQWTVPINVTVSQLIKIGMQPVSFALGVRSYVERPTGGPDWGLRFTTTLLFPK